MPTPNVPPLSQHGNFGFFATNGPAFGPLCLLNIQYGERETPYLGATLASDFRIQSHIGDVLIRCGPSWINYPYTNKKEHRSASVGGLPLRPWGSCLAP